MDNKQWDKGLLKAIIKESKKYYGDGKRIWSLVKTDRKHQQKINSVCSQKTGKEIHDYIMKAAREGLLKRLPKEKTNFFDTPNLSLKKYLEGWNDCVKTIKEKLEGK